MGGLRPPMPPIRESRALATALLCVIPAQAGIQPDGVDSGWRRNDRQGRMPTGMIRRLLIANRGEIAVRIARACRSLGIESVAVYSEADRAAFHVRCADQAYAIGPAEAASSYLNADALLDAARRSGAQALHPGYGFLAESAAFARAVQAAGLIWVGPPPEAIDRLGNKLEARALARKLGVPVVPGFEAGADSDLVGAAAELGYPLLIKAAAGGGGKGMRVARDDGELRSALRLGRGEAQAAFGDGTLYLERLLEHPRHIEVQILGDSRGTVIALGERECSLQRRHQKIVEESPSPAVAAPLRSQLCEAAAELGRAAGYHSAGTVEFLLDREGRFYFLEVNTRLQVEHPVTEAVTGLDLVAEMLRLAAGAPLQIDPRGIEPRGWAIECRIYAEDPLHDFAPSPGRITHLVQPSGPGVRIDSGVEAGDEVSSHYDPLIAKLIAHGADRERARQRCLAALREYRITGVRTVVPFLAELLAEPDFAAGRLHTGLVAELLARTPRGGGPEPELAGLALAASRELQPPAASGRAEARPAADPWAQLGAWTNGAGLR